MPASKARLKNLLLILYGSYITVLVADHFGHFPEFGFGGAVFIPKITALSSASYFLLLVFFAGRPFAARLPIETNGFWRLFFGVGFGIGAVGSTVLVLGWALPGSLSLKLNLLHVVLAANLFFQVKQIKWRFLTSKSPSFSLLETGCLILSAAGIGVSFLSAFSPITYYDSLVYHLALPEYYRAIDTIQAVPFNLYSNFPALIEMNFLFILDQLPSAEYALNLFCWGGTALLCLGIAVWCAELFGRKAGFIATALWWTMPAVLLLSIGGYIDIFLALFIFAATRAFVFFDQLETPSLAWIVASGCMAGCAVSTKYTGGAIVALVALFLIVTRYKTAFIKPLTLFTLASFAPFSLWLVKNAVSIGNPVFPFLYQWFPGKTGWTEATAAGYFGVLTQYASQSSLLRDFIALPGIIFGNPLPFGGGIDVLGDFGWSLVLLGIPMGALFYRSERTVKITCGFFVGLFLIWFLSKPVLRFLIGGLPLGMLLTTAGIKKLTEGGRLQKGLLAITISPWIFSNIFIYCFIASTTKLHSVALGQSDRASFLAQMQPFFLTYENANSRLTAKEMILVLGEQRTYHLKIPYISSNFFAPSELAIQLNQQPNLSTIENYLRKTGITHIILNKPELKRLGGWKSAGFSINSERLIEAFLSSGADFIYENKGVALFQVRLLSNLKTN